MPAPFGVRAEVTADNTSIRVSWQWSCQGVLTCVDLVRVHYQPEGGSLMMYTVDNTTATSATLPNLPGKKKSRLIPVLVVAMCKVAPSVYVTSVTQSTPSGLLPGVVKAVFPEWFFYLQEVLNIPYIHVCMLCSLSQCLL